MADPVNNDTLPRNHGFTTPIRSKLPVSANAIRACIAEDQEVNNGARVKLRLLEPFTLKTFLIPVNTTLYGTARIGGQRLEILITSLESGGNIIPVEFTVYDLDGQKGLYIPDSAERTAMKDVASSVSSGFGNSISFARDASQQLTMDLTRGIMNGGSKYLTNKLQQTKLFLKANYQLLLISKKQ